ncbi:MAG TPA: tetratricopeptide repeat protein [Candidatus Udaeobacter sp.]|nr:tetratricopeptide repeat protein [Candidatus Udaeobacter sp.]
MNLRNLFAELKRRNVYKVAVAYIVAGWALSQGIAQVFPVFDVPTWAIRLIVILIIIGFPVAVVLAWAFEITPQGIKRTEDVDVTRPHSLGGAWIYIAIVGALVSIGLFFLGRYTAGNATPRYSEAAKATSQKSIAVLPLLNESGDPRDEYFSDGLSEELIAALGQISGLKVIGRSSSFRFKDRKEEPKTVAEKLGVSTLLEGTVRKQGDKVRIVAELINAADGIQLWTRTFDRELKDIFAVQEEIARAVAESLKVTLLGSRDRPAQRGAPSNVEAHNAYLQGHFHFQRRNLEDYRKAVGYFDQAIRLDPDYALAYTERSEAWSFIGDLTGQHEPAWSNARSDAEKAVAIAPSLAEARAALGWVRFFIDWKFAEGRTELKRAKELSPANPTANDLLARAILYLGRLDEAERQARQAVELDPLSVIAQGNLARVLFYAGKLDEADAAARKAAELQPASASSHRWQTLIAVQRDDGATALREAQLEPDEGYRRFELALAQYMRGDHAAADAALADLIANGRDNLAYQIAEVYAVRGEKDKAFEWLQIALDNHDTGLLTLLVDPLLRGLRDDPRYKNFLVKLGLPKA